MTRVLVLDEEDLIREILADLLTTGGHVVDTAANGADALEVIHRCRPDAVLVDMLMPDFGAWDFLARYKADKVCRGLPVAILGSTTPVAVALEDVGISAVISNPFDVHDLLQTMDRLVQERLAPTR